MGLRIQAYLVSVLTALSAAYASALGLGEIKLNSALNQPLDAEIKLLQVRDLTEKEIIIGLASKEEFDRLGIDRPHYLTDLSFSVDLNTADGAVVKVRSLKPIREPFLDFIVQAQWPSGRLLREYTLLIDLPVFSGEQGAAPARSAPPTAETPTRPVTRQTPEAPAPVPEAVAPATDVASSEGREPALPGADAAEEYGPVAPNESLWAIASRSRPDTSVSVQQTMLAIQRANPQAFINDNINLLKRGVVLRIPDKEDIQSLTSGDAVRMVAEQNRTWTEQRAPAAGRAQLQGSKTEPVTPAVEPEPEGRVKLVAPPTTESEAPQGAGTSEEATSAALETELAVAQEQFDAARRERSELRSRRTAMDDQIDTIEKLLAVSNEELRELELAARQLNEGSQAGADASQATETTPPVDDVASDPEQAAMTSEPVQPSAEQAPAPKAPVAPAPAERSLVDLLMDNLLYIVLGLAVIAVGIGALFYMRHQSDGFDDDEDLEELATDFTRRNPTETEIADVREDDKTVIAPFKAQENSEAREEEYIEQDLEPGLDAETEDVVAECDIHIAYGQFEQAEEKLRKALFREPENSSVRLKLLEVYTAQQDGEKFDQEYAKLRVAGSREALERAESLRESIVGIGPFDDSSHDISEFRKAIAGGAVIAGGVAAAHAIADDEEAMRSDGESDFEDSFDLGLPETDDKTDYSEILELDFDEDEDEDKTVFGFRRTQEEEDRAALNEDNNADDTTFDLDLDDEPVSAGGLEEAESLGSNSEFNPDSVEFDLGEDFADTFGEDRGTLADKVSAESGSEGLVLDDEHAFEADSTTPFSLGLEETDFSDEDTDELERAELDAELPDDFNLDDLDQDLDDLAGSFDGDFSDLDDPANQDAMEPLSTSAEDFAELELDDDILAEDEADLEGAYLTDADESLPRDTREEPVASRSEADDFQLPEFDPDEDDDTNLGFLSDSDETATKLDLARAYIDMGDADGAKDILDEILEEGDIDQKKEAETLMARLG